jgi:hypothetical protein
VHKSLSETLKLEVTGVAVRHSRKVCVHARVPTTESLYAVVSLEILDIVALTSGAYESTRTATKTRFGKFFPFSVVEKFVEFVGSESSKVNVGVRKF